MSHNSSSLNAISSHRDRERTRENRERFAAETGKALGSNIRAVESADDAIKPADIVLSAYRAKSSPMIRLDAVRPGAMVCGISSVRPQHREVDVAVWEQSRVVVDDLPHVRESGDGKAATERGLTKEADVAELWQVLRNPVLGRHSPDERVLFKSVGTTEQDIALAALVLRRTKSLGLGRDVGEFPALRPIQSEADRAALSATRSRSSVQ